MLSFGGTVCLPSSEAGHFQWATVGEDSCSFVFCSALAVQCYGFSHPQSYAGISAAAPRKMRCGTSLHVMICPLYIFGEASLEIGGPFFKIYIVFIIRH